jgi:hypothetical protein
MSSCNIDDILINSETESLHKEMNTLRISIAYISQGQNPFGLGRLMS